MMAATSSNSRDERCLMLAWIETPLGPMVAGATDDGVCLLEFTDRRMLEAQLKTVRRWFGGAAAIGTNAHLERLRSELAGYFEGNVQAFTVPLVFPGTAFQRRVWERLLAVPYGETRSYQELADEIGDPRAVRAVGRANASNPMPLVLPCHRVLGSDGALRGYGAPGGIATKAWLLDLEMNGFDARK